MHDVFISYSHKNRNIADNICHQLEEKGIRCWYAQRDGRVGEKWAGDIMRAIEDAKVFVLVYTEDANHSDHVLKEVTLAADASCKMIKFVISEEKTNRDLTYHLSIAHWLDATSAPLDKNIRQLVSVVERILAEVKEKEGNASVQVMSTETPEEILSPSNNKGKKEQEPETEKVPPKGKKKPKNPPKTSSEIQPKNPPKVPSQIPSKTESKTKTAAATEPSWWSKYKGWLPLGIMLLVVVLVIGSGLIWGTGGPSASDNTATEDIWKLAGVFGNEDYEREEIISVVFRDGIEAMPKDAWQVSVKSEKPIMAWVEPMGSGYRLVLASDGKVALESCYAMFNKYTNLEEIDFNDSFDTSKVTDMGTMFQNCHALKKLDLSSFDTSMVTNMSYMFNQCNALEELDVSSFDTGRVTDFSVMFQRCERLEEIDVSGFDTAYVTDMSSMFRGCTSLKTLDVSGFNTSSVVDMKYMFFDCNRLQALDVSGFDTSRVTDMSGMFRDCKSLLNLDVSGFKTSSVLNMISMFSDCTLVQVLDVSGFDTSRVTDMSFMFSKCKSLQALDVTNFNTSQVTNMEAMFQECSALTELNVSSFDTANVTDMSSMFRECANITALDLSGFDMKNVVDTKNMFYRAGFVEEETGLYE